MGFGFDAPDMGPRPYDVALSFAGEDRAKAELLASALVQAGIKVYYDQFDDVWGKDLDQHFMTVFEEKARYFVPFVSVAYERKSWPRREFQAARARALEGTQEYILPIRLDDTVLSGLPRTIGYKSWSEHSPADIVQAIEKKLGRVPQDARLAPSKSASETGVAAIAGTDRDALYDALCAMLPTQFSEVLFRLSIPAAELLPEGTAQKRRAGELIERVEQPGGPGLEKLAKVLRRVAPKLLA